MGADATLVSTGGKVLDQIPGQCPSDLQSLTAQRLVASGRIKLIHLNCLVLNFKCYGAVTESQHLEP